MRFVEPLGKALQAGARLTIPESTSIFRLEPTGIKIKGALDAIHNSVRTWLSLLSARRFSILAATRFDSNLELSSALPLEMIAFLRR